MARRSIRYLSLGICLLSGIFGGCLYLLNPQNRHSALVFGVGSMAAAVGAWFTRPKSAKNPLVLREGD
jgi:hypothetical protein